MMGYPIGGTIVRQWTPARIASEIAATGNAIRAALHRGDMDAAWLHISRKTGLRVCAGEIKVSLKPHRQV